MENHVGQIAKILFEKTLKGLPSNIKTNPKEQVKAITFKVEKRWEQKKFRMRERLRRKKEVEQTPLREYQPHLAYSEKVRKDEMVEQFKKFLKLFKQQHINIPLVKALFHIPKYVNFLNELLSNNKKFEEVSIAILDKQCSATLHIKLLRKPKDPGSFVMPYLVGS